MSKKDPYQDLITPKSKKVAAKRAVQKAAAKAVEETAEKIAMTVAFKTTAKTGAKVAGKTFLRTAANPWLLAADGVELGVGAVCKKNGYGR